MKRFFKVILVLALLAALTYGGYVLHQRQPRLPGCGRLRRCDMNKT